MRLQDRFREARLARGLSQVAAGRELGVNWSTVLRWEKSETLPARVVSHIELWIAENRHERDNR